VKLKVSFHHFSRKLFAKIDENIFAKILRKLTNHYFCFCFIQKKGEISQKIFVFPKVIAKTEMYIEQEGRKFSNTVEQSRMGTA
jgi:hypothetical protein